MLFITIGLGFIFINLNINDIQIVPSFVGYLLIALGSSQLKKESVYFRRILPAAIVMTVINVWSYLMSLMTASEWSGVVSDLYQTIFWVILLLILSAIAAPGDFGGAGGLFATLLLCCAGGMTGGMLA